MRDGDSSIGWASFGGIAATSTMFADLYSELAPHPWRAPLVASEDAYSLFHARSSAMGWLTEGGKDAACGCWGMNDAGQDPDSGSRPPRVAWFQVSLTEPVPAQSLPTPSDMDAVATLVQGTGWFADCDPHQRARVRITMDGGRDPSICSATPGMVRWMLEINQDVFICDAYSLADEDAVTLKPDITDELWLGPSQHRATFRGTLAEWSLDALGWSAAFLAAASSLHGVGTPLMLTASRMDG